MSSVHPGDWQCRLLCKFLIRFLFAENDDLQALVTQQPGQALGGQLAASLTVHSLSVSLVHIVTATSTCNLLCKGKTKGRYFKHLL